MLRTHWSYSAKDAVSYLAMTDYYATSFGELLGKGFDQLNIKNMSARDVFECLAHNTDPATGQPLRPHAKVGDRVGIDFTFNSTKSVGIARELAGHGNEGDPRIEAAHREAVAYTMNCIEADMATRVRIGGADSDRVTGNLLAYRVTHRDTRINAEDHRPDMSLHDHVYVLNATFDPVERKWKAAQIGQIKHDAPYYEAIYHNRLATNLRQLGYGIRRKDKAFEINGISDELVRKFSRRRQYIEKVAEKLGITNPAARDKLGATTRLGKADEREEDLHHYYVSRLTADERQALSGLEGKDSYVSNDRSAVEYAIAHLFERKSVVEEKRLYETTLRYGIGSVTPEGVMKEAHKQGLLVKGQESTTKSVLEEEGRIIAYAREGRGTVRPLSYHEKAPDLSRLSADQQAVVSHIWRSTDRVIMIEGDAGTGKTDTMQVTIPGIDKPGLFLAPSATASRGVLREKGFSNADTIRRFLDDEKFREQARNGYIYIDEAPLAALKDIDAVFQHARDLNARIILQGDRKQHHNPQRGNLFEVLDRYAGLPIGRLTKNWRQQKTEYKQAVDLIAKGDILKGYDKLVGLGWIKETPVFDHNRPLVDDYLASQGKSVLIVAPTHKEGEEITEEIRRRLKEEGTLGKKDHVVERLVPLRWTDAEKADLARYQGTEVLQFHRNSGSFRAGERVRVSDWKPGQRAGKAGNYSVYERSGLQIASGDRIRITANGKDQSGQHRLDNGSEYTIRGFTKEGDIALTNGWVLDKSFGHLDHAYTTTSHASQGKTVDRVLIALGHESRFAINAETFYVSVSRGRESARIYTNMAPVALREAIQQQEIRKSATELMGGKIKRRRREKVRGFMSRIRHRYQALRDMAVDAMSEKKKERKHGVER